MSIIDKINVGGTEYDVADSQARADLVTAQNDISELQSGAGGSEDLTTTAKTYVGAINELDAEAEQLATSISGVSTNLGDVNSLGTSNKTAVTAINEVNSNIGSLSSLTTTDKSSVVAALNEQNEKLATVYDLSAKPKQYLSAGMDLNDITEAGTYISSGHSVSSSLLNCPFRSSAFKMVVDKASDKVLKQTITVGNDVNFTPYFRIKDTSNVWSEWKNSLSFGVDGEGNYGYFKGDGTFVPFKRDEILLDSGNYLNANPSITIPSSSGREFLFVISGARYNKHTELLISDVSNATFEILESKYYTDTWGDPISITTIVAKISKVDESLDSVIVTSNSAGQATYGSYILFKYL